MNLLDLAQDQKSPVIMIGEKDHRCLTMAALTDVSYHADEVDFLLYELDRAKVVKDTDLPPNIVRLNSIVRYRAEDGNERSVKLVLADDTIRGNAFRLAVTSMHGAALVGLLPGQTMSWMNAEGRSGYVEVLNVAN